MFRWGILLLGLLFCTPGSLTFAQEPDNAAGKQHYQVGKALFDSGRHAEAAKEFEASFQASKKPALLVNAFIAYRNAGDIDNAVRVGDHYLKLAPDSPQAEEIRPALAAMKEKIDARQAEAKRNSEEQQRLEAAAAASAAEAKAERERAARADEARRQAEESNGSSPIPYIVAGSGAALIAGGIVTGLLARNEIGNLDSDCPNNRCPTNYDLSGKQDSAKTLALTTDILLASGAIAVGTGIALLFILDGGDDEDDEAPPVAIGCTLDGCSASATINF